MDERPLMLPTGVAGRGVYRFAAAATWGPPYVVRLEVQNDGTGMLVKKQARSQTEAGTLTVNVTQGVSKEDISMFESLLDKADFWSMPAVLVSARDPRIVLMGMGGTAGVLEGAKPGIYHVVTRYFPYFRTPTNAYDELTAYLFRDLAHFEIPPPPLPSRKQKR
jgi:hypothetical protein